MLLNFFAALGNVHAVECRPGFRDWLSGHQSPAKRSDYAAVASLVDYLRCAATPQDIILVFASSGAMNEDLLRHADSQLHACDGPRLSVFASPQIDSRDYYPLECLLFAKYVVVAHPFQRQVYIPVDQQKVCRVGYDALVEKWEIAGDFEPMPKTFLLDGGVTAQVYRRIRPTSAATAVRTLQRMEAYVGRRPGTQVSWMFLNGERFGHSLYPEIEYFSDLGFRSKEPRAPAMVCIDHVPRRGELQGRLDLPDPRCPGARVILSALAPDGTVTSLGAATLRRTESQWDFRLPFSIGDADHLLLTLATLDDRDVSREGVAVWVKGLKAVAAGEGPGK